MLGEQSAVRTHTSHMRLSQPCIVIIDFVENMEGENRVNRLKVQRLESRRKTRDTYKVVGCLMPYRLCALTSARSGSCNRFCECFGLVIFREDGRVSSVFSFVDDSEEFGLKRYGELWGEIGPVRSVSIRRSGSERKWKCRGLNIVIRISVCRECGARSRSCWKQACVGLRCSTSTYTSSKHVDTHLRVLNIVFL